MPSRNINVFLVSFCGLGLPLSSNLICPDTQSLKDLRQHIAEILPALGTRLIITTISSKELLPSTAPISSLLPSDHDDFLQLRLSVPLCGGKGGFGSQLRAAGGRMSSKRKTNQGDTNSSNRNLDGRRMRTVNEAKALAEYLALKPEMEKKEKEARRKRWEQVVELAERREEEIRNGSKGKVDGKWVEDKEEASERTREAVSTAMRSAACQDRGNDSPVGGVASAAGRSGSSQEGILAIPCALEPAVISARSFADFNEDDEFMSDSEDEIVELEEGGRGAHKGKVKA